MAFKAKTKKQLQRLTEPKLVEYAHSLGLLGVTVDDLKDDTIEVILTKQDSIRLNEEEPIQPPDTFPEWPQYCEHCRIAVNECHDNKACPGCGYPFICCRDGVN